MLILGALGGLYYRSVMIALSLAVLLASAPHFATVAPAAVRALAARMIALRHGEGVQPVICALLIAVCGAWLLIVRGLYPGGGGDYFTHYFPYYLEVVGNHGLAPNDVWYH